MWLVSFGHPAYAGVRDFLNNLFESHIKYQIYIVDDGGNPLPGASLWVLKNSRKRHHFTAETMRYLVERYGKDSDFVFNGELIPELMVFHSDRTGKIAIDFGEGDVRDLSALEIAFAAMRRGYKATVHYEKTPVNTSRTIELKIARDKTMVFDKRLALLDELQAATAELMLQRKKQGIFETEIKKLEEEARSLANEFEKEGGCDNAAIVYYRLAYMSRIDFAGADESSVVTGYTSGYDKASPERKYDLNMALRLNRSTPIILYKQKFNEFESSGALKWTESSSVVRQNFINTTEDFFYRYGDRMWGWPYLYLWQAYDAEREYQKACDAVQRFHQFEPNYFSPAGWLDLADSVEVRAKFSGGNVKCKIQETN